MANETNCSVESDNQVDLNNNSNNEKLNNDVNRGDDLVLKLKRIILEQEEKELKKNQQKSPKSVKKLIKESPKLVKKLIIGNNKEIKSPKMDKKILNDSSIQLNGNKSIDELNNNAINQPQIKDTIKKLNDKVNQLDLNKSSTNLTNGDIKILVNDNSTIESNNDKINDNSTIESNNDKINNNLVNNTEEIKNQKNDNTEEIKIIQSKSPNNKSIKIDLNNNLDQILQNKTKQLNQQSINKDNEIDKLKESIDNKIENSDHYEDTTDNKINLNDDNQTIDLAKAEIKNEEIPEIELIIRASNIDSKRKGADLFCQEYFMDLYLLTELNYIRLKISTVDLKKPPANFRSKFDCTKPPILLVKVGDEQRAILENEKIERYIMKNIPGGHLLFRKDIETAKLIENLYSKFKLALSRNEPQTKQSLLKHLAAIDKHLEERKTKYLTSDYVCCFDCELITKLQHIRIAGSYFIDEFEIPSNLTYLWNYMNRMYHLNAFIESSPSDQDILSHYLDSNTVLLNRASPSKKNQQHIELQKPCISISTP